jgi:uncharacterized protein
MPKEIVGRGWAFPLKIGSQGRLVLTNERNELDQAIQIILKTAPGQRVMRPTFGCRLHELVFVPNNSDTAARARRYVEEALAMWEPRINLQEVRVKADFDPHNLKMSGHQLLIEIDYEVKATHDRRSLVYPFYLIPEEG